MPHLHRTLSGIQATNALTLGNYLGALKNWVDAQAAAPNEEMIFFIADLHAITVPYDVTQIRPRVQAITAAYLASGLDPKKAIIFPQSMVPAHPQLMWLLASLTQMGKLDRMTQFKDKAGKNSERAGLGLYAYPVLMAADILLYKATHVPVGEDQIQHVELTRDIASTFNHHYGVDFFPLPEAVVKRETMRIMSLRDGTKKMSKSDESDYSRINMTDDADTIAQKIKKAKTDPEPVPTTIENMNARPEAKNLITIMAALSDEYQTPEAVMAQFGGQTFSGFKNALTDVLVAKMGPITQKMRYYLDHTDEIDRVLADGAARAGAIAAPVLSDVQKIMGFTPYR